MVKLLENHSNDIQIASNEKARVLFLERTVLKTVKFGRGKGFGFGRQRQHWEEADAVGDCKGVVN